MKIFILLLSFSVSAFALSPKKAASAPSMKDLGGAATTKELPAPAVTPAKTEAKLPGKVMVTMDTSMGGPIKIELNAEKAPITVKNFLTYVDSKFYDNTIFHRVINGFMIQGGGFVSGMTEKNGNKPIINEAKNGLSNDEGTLAMARTNDPNSASSQFFINVGNNTNLNYPAPDGHGYAVFGRVTEGMNIINRIKQVKTGNKGPHGDVPVDDIIIKSVRRL